MSQWSNLCSRIFVDGGGFDVTPDDVGGVCSPVIDCNGERPCLGVADTNGLDWSKASVMLRRNFNKDIMFFC